MTRRKKDDWEDDGRTIVSMESLDELSRLPFRITGRKRKEDKEALRAKIEREEALTKAEYRRYTWYSILAALTVMGIVGGGMILVILLMLLLWK